MEQVLGHFQPNVLSVSKTTSDAGLRALCCVCVGVCLFIFAVRRNGTVFNQKRIKDEKTDLRMFAGPVCIGLKRQRTGTETGRTENLVRRGESRRIYGRGAEAARLHGDGRRSGGADFRRRA